ncbi:uncharacterized protein [Medicago truncatula]|uniref:uncharacterized protein n=1 Tax=Medicago truncatula TaxID=3880 RepID=UPI001967AC0E|nr:uncharacterized protein LOC120578159 [Medicago truncatula]
MVIYIANTVENQGRRFWKCRNWQKARKCNLLIWDDELGPSTRPFVTVSATPSNASIEQPRKESSKAVVEEVKQGMSNVETRSEKCNCAETLQGMWDGKKEKMKMKLVQQKKKFDWLKLFVIVSWVFFVVCYAKK